MLCVAGEPPGVVQVRDLVGHGIGGEMEVVEVGVQDHPLPAREARDYFDARFEGLDDISTLSRRDSSSPCVMLRKRCFGGA